jgi:hypothetical protein
MLSQDEKNFMEYWEKNRDKQKRVVRQFLLGIPAGLLFVIPIVINFSSGWYKRAGMMTNTSDFNPGVLIVALLLITGFIAIFSRRHRWEQNEQAYKELRAREAAENSDQEKK